METGKKQKRKAVGTALAAAVLAMSVCTAYAADGSQSQSMTLTIRKEPSYTLTIPKNQSISFGRVDTDIGKLSVTGNIRSEQEVRVSVRSMEFTDTADTDNHFPFTLFAGDNEFEEKTWSSREVNGETSEVTLTVHIPSKTWGSTGPGTYEAVLTFQAELLGGE